MVHIVRNIDVARLSAYIRDVWYFNVKPVQSKSYNRTENEEEERERERENKSLPPQIYGKAPKHPR